MHCFDIPRGGGGRHQERKGKDFVQQIQVTLEEVYNGAVRMFELKRNVICKKCEGRGGKKGASQNCGTCRGQGVEIKVHQVLPGFFQEQVQICGTCHGQRNFINAKDRCKTCNGKMVVQDRKILEVHVKKGMPDGHRIVFKGESDQEPNLQPGDVIVELIFKKHPVFRFVNGNDLGIVVDLQLVESLCGFRKVIKTMGGRDLVVTSLPGEVVKNNGTKCIPGEGLPKYKNPIERGRLILQFNVIFPSAIPMELVPKLQKCLPPQPHVEIPINAEECKLTDYDPNANSQRRHRQAYEDDNKDYYRARVQQCANS